MKYKHAGLAVAALAIGAAVYSGPATAREDPPVVHQIEPGLCPADGSEPQRRCAPGEFPAVEEGFFYSRLAGFNRYDTAALVEGIEYTEGKVLFVASADNAHLVDSMFAIDNIARHPDATLLPVPKDGPVPDPIRFAIHDLTDITNVIVIGGRDAVSDRVFAQVVVEAALGAGPGR